MQKPLKEYQFSDGNKVGISVVNNHTIVSFTIPMAKSTSEILDLLELRYKSAMVIRDEPTINDRFSVLGNYAGDIAMVIEKKFPTPDTPGPTVNGLIAHIGSTAWQGR